MTNNKKLELSQGTKQELRDLIKKAAKDLERIAEIASLTSLRVSLDYQNTPMRPKIAVKVDAMRAEETTINFDDQGQICSS